MFHSMKKFKVDFMVGGMECVPYLYDKTQFFDFNKGAPCLFSSNFVVQFVMTNIRSRGGSFILLTIQPKRKQSEVKCADGKSLEIKQD